MKREGWFGWIGGGNKVPQERINKAAGLDREGGAVMGGKELVEAFKRGDAEVCEEYFYSSTGTVESIAKELAENIRQNALAGDIEAILEKIEQSRGWVGTTQDKLDALAKELRKTIH